MGTIRYIKNNESYVGGFLLVFGLAVVSVKNKLIAGGISLVVAGIGAIAYGITKQFLKDMGMF